eukprot:CAMPEP_0115836710 /NCGR_PEP_ID=MMETSP0287-20121206/4850_1 /TAXON_ID=412157 /ORGANISM="Chrysochromulina rotalis, Strain UIO044" /LENGTH=500 /DNA_ID=CAMNT_0003290207 /DNA_START=1 /DNA_END=1503 /DNA_ORIENTATION=-
MLESTDSPRDEEEDDSAMFARVEAEERQKFAAQHGMAPVAEVIDDAPVTTDSDPHGLVPLKTVAQRFAILGAVAFGGPPAHVALMQVQPWRPNIVDDAAFASLFALTQCLPGPSSTQLAIALGILQGGVYGGLVAFACFSVTATTTMAILGSMVHVSAGTSLGPTVDAVLRAINMGLSAGAVALVVKAALTLSAKLASERMTRSLNVFAAAVALLAPGTPWVLPTALCAAGLVSASAKSRGRKLWTRVGLLDPAAADDDGDEPPASAPPPPTAARETPIERKLAISCFAAWLSLLLMLGLWNTLGGPWWIDLLERFYRVGSLVWGGGPVVLPLLLREVVPRFVSDERFLQGFAFVQAMPGPMFNFSAFLGGAYAGPVGALLAWVGLFLPGLLLVYAALPFWAIATTMPAAQAFLTGVNAAASGLVVAAALLLLDHIPAPPQRAIAVICFAVHHFHGAELFGPKLNPPATILIGALLAIPLCLPHVYADVHSEAPPAPPGA